MKQFKWMRVWDIIYPIGIYYVVTSIALFVLDFMIPNSTKTQLLRQFIAGVAAFPFLYTFYRQDQSLRGKKAVKSGLLEKKARLIREILLVFVTGCSVSVVLNNVIGFTGIKDGSRGYAEVTKSFYGGSFVIELLALCLIIPLVEELLYRGIVYQRLRDFIGLYPAILISAFIFGAVHMNLVQFVYATLFGLLLAWLTQQAEGYVYLAAMAHMGANLTSVLRTETGLLSFLDTFAGLILGTAVFSAAALGGVILLQKELDGPGR